MRFAGMMRDSDLVWRLEGQAQQTLIGLYAATEHLTVGRLSLLPGQSSSIERHGGDERLRRQEVPSPREVPPGSGQSGAVPVVRQFRARVARRGRMLLRAVRVPPNGASVFVAPWPRDASGDTVSGRMRTSSRSVALLVFDEVELLDVGGVLSVLSTAGRQCPRCLNPRFRSQLIGFRWRYRRQSPNRNPDW